MFDAVGVDLKVCLGQIVGLYPYVDDCVTFLDDKGYATLQSLTDYGFLGYCDGSYDFRGWSTIYLVEALKFAAKNVAPSSLSFMRDLPEHLETGGIAFEARPTARGSDLHDAEDVASVFASCDEPTVVHAAHFDPCMWGEDLRKVDLTSPCTRVPFRGRLLISTGGVGCHYHGSANTRKPAAIVFDSAERTIELLRPTCDVMSIFADLRRTEYPQEVLADLESREYEVWRKPPPRTGD
jgi:hypothetical protein